MKYWIFNLKSNLTFEEIKSYENKIKDLRDKIIIAPSLVYLDYFKERGYTTCAQNVSAYDMGEYTGEVNAKQLQSLATSYVIVGHYERRKYCNESTKMIVSKIKQSLNNNLKVILCIGSDNYETNNLKNNIDDIYSQLKLEDYSKIIIAYEPYNLIGQNSNIDINKVQENISFIQEYIKNYYNHNPELIYGGSVNDSNIKDLQKLTIDGFIIGKYTLNVDSILTLII